ncbi:preprotein translocase subunit SecB [Legionella geestiana]|uniref:Protein-export protein SecB n=1 Tax=Legionella geestiana TaxID=45065 RepID=A0A0W0U7S9_9GAMM|nr:protein-export chaperone SecB [Legionella geestiana]KTD03834.1 preprotein translocase subunit SecB [Legionella geestiana]QBS11886.1 protein-export chaperone SecB [Legionella geestiana]QDQ40501.1 protein-export chaperone SecB [Legionella geestiana]STX53409.1 preprotein translocase SecB subunit [Legionella geestiana]
MSEQQQEAGMQFMIQRVYTKDVSFETPNSPAIFQQQWEPELELEINTSNTRLDEGVYEVVVSVTTTARNRGQVAFLVEVAQAGIFTIEGAEPQQLDQLLGSFCPSLLFPYARETITSLVVRGSFPQLVLAPVNFDALYLQQLEERQQQQEEETTH